MGALFILGTNGIAENGTQSHLLNHPPTTQPPLSKQGPTMHVLPRLSLAGILLLFMARILAQEADNDKESMLEEINKFRKANGKKPVCMDP